MRRLKDSCAAGTSAAGFTLIELIIAIFVSLLVMAAIVLVYIEQRKSSTMQDEVANIQQELRGALVILTKEIRMAGCDPKETGAAGFLVATPTQLQFTRDIKGDAAHPNMANGTVNDPDENIAYSFTPAANSTAPLLRQSSAAAGFQSLADDIEELEFNYILADGTSSLAPGDLGQIRAVQVSMLARATRPSSDMIGSVTYTTPGGSVWARPADHFRRKYVTVTIGCRNMWYAK